MKAYLNASEFARLLGVDRATVSRWVKQGKIKGAIRPESNEKSNHQWRIPLEVYDQLVKRGSQ